LPSRSG